MKKLIIAGGSGFLGELLIDFYKSKVETIYVLTRGKTKSIDNIHYQKWDAETLGDWTQILEGADVLINMTGKSVDCRYNRKNKDLIMSSRVQSTKLLGNAIKSCTNAPRLWLNSSTATIYRHSLDKEMDEKTGEIGTGFSVSVAKAWERQFFSFKLDKTRQVALRTSIVLGKKGGAFVPIKKLAQVGMGGKQGTGNQKVSWIHEDDFVNAIHFIVTNEKISNAVNIVSPKPTTNSTLMKTIRTSLKMPLGIPMSVGLLKFGARLIGTETELILKSRNVIPGKLIEQGFKFKYPTLKLCIDQLLNK